MEKIKILVLTSDQDKSAGICQALETDERIGETRVGIGSALTREVAEDAAERSEVIVYAGVPNEIVECEDDNFIGGSLNISGGVDQLFEHALELFNNDEDIQKEADEVGLSNSEAITNIYTNILLAQEGWVKEIVNVLNVIPTKERPVKLSDLISALEGENVLEI